ncbi:nuclear transport factor 2 family protein [Streptomyces sp. NPDC004787]|uniref:nuclear transport factor 2 family protein n=1 Tax=Streptomyces sp. NPDC004787 TaxID=3154291 RepID=UPI0033B36E56
MSSQASSQETRLLVGPGAADSHDLPAIQQAMLDYALGWYGGDQEQMRRALHPALAKRAILPTETGGMELSEYPAEALIARVTKNQPADFAQAATKKTVTVFAVHGNTATGLLEMDDWTDFMHILKVNGTWQVINILWEPNE